MTNTFEDMWNMVLEQNIVSIVMLCKMIENDKVKYMFKYLLKNFLIDDLTHLLYFILVKFKFMKRVISALNNSV